ncbi:MAG: tetratricopeptide repeat protein [Planctomycetota bacterium]
MSTRKSLLCGGLAVLLAVTTLSTPARADDGQFTLARAIPNDVFLYVATQHNPEREFLEEYWGKVFEALAQCGIGEELLGLLGAVLDGDEMDEVERLKERAAYLLEQVEWKQLIGGEFVFAERFDKLLRDPKGRIIKILMPDMVWMFRGTPGSTEQNYAGLVGILDGLTEEINRLAGHEVLTVERLTEHGAEVATVNLLASASDAPPLPLSIARRDDLIVITMGQDIRAEVLGLLAGQGPATALANDARFQQAFAQLPQAEDSMVFFDLHALLKPLWELVEFGLSEANRSRDRQRNTGRSAEANEISGRASAAYQTGDYEQALELIQQAYKVAPDDSRVLYNLACFSTLRGDKDAGLTWLDKAVDAGFHAPNKIASDSDLDDLRDDPRYQATLAKATELAASYAASDTIINSTKSGKLLELSTQAWKSYEQRDYEQGLALIEQAYEIAPEDSRILYYLACFHALLDHEDQALDFLEQAVAGGFYAPGHISKDPDLESLHDNQRYEAALTQARREAAKLSTRQSADWATMAGKIAEQLYNAVGVLDYTAAVERTDQYSVHLDSIAMLVPDARSRPIYPVFNNPHQLESFERYLPQETMSFSISSGPDLQALYNFAEDTLKNSGPAGEELLGKWSALQAEWGFDIRQDVLGWIDSEYINVTLADGRGSVLLIKVTDEQKARENVSAALDFALQKLSELVSENPMLAMMTLSRSPASHQQLEGFESLTFALMPQQPAIWGVKDEFLIVGSSADAVLLCLKTARGEHPNVRQNGRIMTEAILPEGPFVSMSFTDQRNLGEEIAMGLGMVSMMGGMMTMAIPDPDARMVISKITGMVAKLSPVMRKIDFYKSTASTTTFDGQTWYTKMVTHYVSPDEHASEQAP